MYSISALRSVPCANGTLIVFWIAARKIPLRDCGKKIRNQRWHGDGNNNIKSIGR